MDEAGADFLAGAALALDQDGDVGLGDHLQFSPDHLHLGGAAKENIHRREIDLSFVVRETHSGHIFLSPIARIVSLSWAIDGPGNLPDTTWVP
jgi:hypothetical protein